MAVLTAFFFARGAGVVCVERRFCGCAVAGKEQTMRRSFSRKYFDRQRARDLSVGVARLRTFLQCGDCRVTLIYFSVKEDLTRPRRLDRSMHRLATLWSGFVPLHPRNILVRLHGTMLVREFHFAMEDMCRGHKIHTAVCALALYRNHKFLTH